MAQFQQLENGTIHISDVYGKRAEINPKEAYDLLEWLYARRDALHRAKYPTLQQETGDGKKYSTNQLRARYAKEDIELVCGRIIPVDIAIIHTQDDQGKPLLSQSSVSLHFPDEIAGYKSVGATLDDVGHLSLGEITDIFGIAPDEQVWEINEDI